MNKLINYGVNEKIEKEASEYEGLYLARVLSLSRGVYSLITNQGEMKAEIAGKFRHKVLNVTEYPAVGDFVLVDRIDDSTGNGIISNVISRKSVFIRKASGNEMVPQVVAANIDYIFICMSLNNNYNLHRLERYLSLVWESGATPVVVLTKIDLCEDYLDKYNEVQNVAIGVNVIGVSAVEVNGYESIERYLQPGKTIALIGSSGVGKSTLINHLVGNNVLDTNQVGYGDKGRHTTTRRELVILPSGCCVIDTPGMRELGMWDTAEGLDKTFLDVETYIGRCKFSDCTHMTEPGCAIREAIKCGDLSEERFESYLHLKEEDSYNSDKSAYLKQKREKYRKIAKTNRKNK